MNVEQHINEITHKSNVLKFWVKLKCQTHLYIYYCLNVIVPLTILITEQREPQYFNNDHKNVPFFAEIKY